MRCYGKIKSGERCLHKARSGLRYCGHHKNYISKRKNPNGDDRLISEDDQKAFVRRIKDIIKLVSENIEMFKQEAEKDLEDGYSSLLDKLERISRSDTSSIAKLIEAQMLVNKAWKIASDLDWELMDVIKSHRDTYGEDPFWGDNGVDDELHKLKKDLTLLINWEVKRDDK